MSFVFRDDRYRDTKFVRAAIAREFPPREKPTKRNLQSIGRKIFPDDVRFVSSLELSILSLTIEGPIGKLERNLRNVAQLRHGGSESSVSAPDRDGVTRNASRPLGELTLRRNRALALLISTLATLGKRNSPDVAHEVSRLCWPPSANMPWR